MVNLLTIFEKKRIMKEYRMRLVLLWLFVVAFLVIASIILLSPSLVYSLMEHKDVSTQLEMEKGKAAQTQNGEDPISITKDTNKKLKMIGADTTSLPTPSSIILLIVENKLSGVYINEISFDGKEDGGVIVVKGVAANRETLLSFLKALESQELFDGVELPVSSFVKGENIDFSMRVTMKMAGVKIKNNRKDEQ